MIYSWYNFTVVTFGCCTRLKFPYDCLYINSYDPARIFPRKDTVKIGSLVTSKVVIDTWNDIVSTRWPSGQHAGQIVERNPSSRTPIAQFLSWTMRDRHGLSSVTWKPNHYQSFKFSTQNFLNGCFENSGKSNSILAQEVESFNPGRVPIWWDRLVSRQLVK